MPVLAVRRSLFVLIATVAVGCVDGLFSTPALAVAPIQSVDRLQLPSGFLLSDDSFDEQIGSSTKGAFRELRRYWRTVTWMFGRAADWWGGWVKRGIFSVFVAIVAAITDSGLLNAWRLNGWRTVTTYVPMMLYVYGRLLFASGVNLGPKLMLAAAILYGAVRQDFIPDRKLLHGRVEDIILIALATRAFIYACPEALVADFAQRAIRLRSRVQSFQQRAR